MNANTTRIAMRNGEPNRKSVPRKSRFTRRSQPSPVVASAPGKYAPKRPYSTNTATIATSGHPATRRVDSSTIAIASTASSVRSALSSPMVSMMLGYPKAMYSPSPSETAASSQSYQGVAACAPPSARAEARQVMNVRPLTKPQNAPRYCCGKTETPAASIGKSSTAARPSTVIRTPSAFSAMRRTDG
ncbi:MAG: hypothetical protein M5U08_15705 [Burkholderiales bacterium]|nr:hypothetical protein [Burkholderiales bacterium]